MLTHHAAKPFPVEVRMTKLSVNTCRTCGKSFQSYKAGGYCGMPCYRKAQKAGEYIGSRGHRADLVRSCDRCGAKVIAGKRTTRRCNTCQHTYCSRECYDAARTAIREARKRPCDHCGKPYIAPNTGKSRIRFCSAECRFIGLKAEPITCIQCGVWVTPVRLNKATGRFVSQCNRKVCSDECKRERFRTNPERKAKISAAFKGEKHPNWQGGRPPQLHRSTWDRIADAIRDRDGHKCQRCGKGEAENGRTMDVHHIVPRRECLSLDIANHPDNLTTLCQACHMWVEWATAQKRGTRRRGKRCKKAA